MGDSLVVGLTVDQHVNKPGRPIQTWPDRREMLMALKYVDAVIPCRNAVEAILKVCPYYFVKGWDYESLGLEDDESEACRQIGAVIRFTHTPKRSTTELIRRIQCAS